MIEKSLLLATIALWLVILATICQGSSYQKKVVYFKTPHSQHAKSAKFETYTKKGYIPVHVPTYEFGYKIHDPHHKNYQEKSEVRLGDSVQGFYSVLQPNGVIQLVRYHSDDSGFHTKVSHHKSKSTD